MSDWSDGENGRFEDALNTYGPETPGRWELVAAAVGGGRTVDDVIRHNDRLNTDIHDIHAGNHPLQQPPHRHHAAQRRQQQQHGGAQQANGGGTAANNHNNNRRNVNDRRSNGGGGGTNSSSNNNTNRRGNNRGNRPQA